MNTATTTAAATTTTAKAYKVGDPIARAGD
jgi:hypothetical protein